MTRVGKNMVVTLRYKVSDPDGAVLDAGEHPLTYIHGLEHSLFPRLQAALDGKEAGDMVQIKLQPEDAFGEYDAELVHVEARSLFPDSIEPGMQFERVEDEDGGETRVYTITDIEQDKVVIDGNHQLAGIALVFECTVTDVRTASDEELAHGHVHGPGGHHH